MQQNLATSSFLLLLIITTFMFGRILEPFFGPILWAAIIAILFHPLKRRWGPYFKERKNLLALAVLMVCTFMVILPLLGVITTLAQEGIGLYEKVKSGEIDASGLVEKTGEVFPAAQSLFNRFGVDIGALKQPLKDASLQASQYIATQALSIGQNTAQFFVAFSLTLYLAFFFLRDGESLVRKLIHALPLGDEREKKLLNKIAIVINATVRGGFTVGATQGALGGVIFWILGVGSPFLCGVIMAFASLIPAVGAALVWGPVAIYFLATGAIWKGVTLIVFGVGVIGLVDNLLRPILVGRDTNLPDYVVLFSTLGGISLFGLNGVVVGPLVAAVFIALWGIFERDFNPS